MSVEKVLGKLRAAQMCHPSAVQALIDEAIAAIQQAEAQPPDTGEPVYQICKKDSQCISSAWIDVEKQAYEDAGMYPEYGRRTLYTHPAPSVPVAWMASYVDPIGNDHVYVTSHHDLAVENDMHGEPKPLYTRPAPSVPDDVVRVPVQVLKDASEALGNFVSDHGWGDADMQAMDNLDAYIARHDAKAQKGQP